MEFLETEAATILQFFAGLRGTLSVTFEERTWVGISPIGGAAIPDTPVLQFGRDSIVNEPVGDRNARHRDIQVEWNEQDGDLSCTLFTMQFRKTILIPHFNKPASRARS